MKKLFVILAFLSLSIAAFAQSGRDIYNKYSDLPGVEAVYISSAMFRMIGRLPDIEVASGKDVNLSSLVKSMSGFYVLNAPDSAVGDRLHTDVKKYIDSDRYELLMEAKDDGEVMRMYSLGDEKTVHSLVILAKEKDETSFICIDGKMNREELENILAGTID